MQPGTPKQNEKAPRPIDAWQVPEGGFSDSLDLRQKLFSEFTKVEGFQQTCFTDPAYYTEHKNETYKAPSPRRIRSFESYISYFPPSKVLLRGQEHFFVLLQEKGCPTPGRPPLFIPSAGGV